MSEFLNELIGLHPELYAFYDSQQYKLSKTLIEHMVANHLTEEQICNSLDIETNYLARLTSGDNTIDASEYNYLINKLHEITK
ncbi:hypothetical protein [Bacillus sp. FJAT-22090]|uniref:hypothetical protein n=1 Tax=Bacillus sp. FJAT-22090 TaxID=1581038 RepID=UPI0011A38251|nr:hypothetical protein [Bacillus sp. FJAT-22090]